MIRVLVTDTIVQQGIDLLSAAGYEVLQIPFSETEKMVEALPTVQAWVIRSGSQISAELLDKATNLKVIGRAGVGVDNVDLAAATRRGVVVMNTPGGNTISAAEHTFAMMLSLARHIPEADKSIKSGKWERKHFTGNELRGKTLGVIGLGRIGQEVIRRAQSFEMTILGYDPYVDPERIGLKNVTAMALDDLVAESDFITLHLPKNKATENLIDAKRLATMKSSARIINCARGGLIDEIALAEALHAGKIAGAAIDVFVTEPPTDNPLLSAPNIVLTPHLGASTVEAGESVAVEICEQIRAYLTSQKMTNAVNAPVPDLAVFKQIQPNLDLANRMGFIAHHLIPGKIDQVILTFGGEAAHIQPLLLSALRGLLRERYDSEINFINAKYIAQAQGVELVTVSDQKIGDLPSAIALKIVGSDGHNREIVGYADQNGIGRLTRLDEFKFDIAPNGNLLFIENFDVPGVVGRVGTILGDAQVNIAGISLSRNKERKIALAIVRCDQMVSELVVEKLLSDSAIQNVVQVV